MLPIDVPPNFSNTALTIDEIDAIAMRLNYPPNSEIVKNKVDNFSPLFNMRSREILWYLDKFEKKTYEYEVNPDRNVIQVEDIKFDPNISSTSYQSMYDVWLKKLIGLVKLQPLETGGTLGNFVVGISYL